MYCPSCGSEITVELNYCNRCGANLSVPANIAAPAAPVRLTGPSVVVGLTIIGALIVILSSAVKLVEIGLNPVALAWIVIFSLATLFGCSALLIRFWSMIIRTQRSSLSSPPLSSSQLETWYASFLSRRSARGREEVRSPWTVLDSNDSAAISWRRLVGPFTADAHDDRARVLESL